MDVYLHGLGQNPNTWDAIRQKLGRESVAIALFELRDYHEKLNYGALYQALSQELSQYESIDKLVGLSLGGILALNYAVDNPEQVQELIISGAQYKMPKNLMKLQIGMFKVLPDRFYRNSPINKEDFIELMRSSLDLDLTDKLPDYSGRAKILIGSKDRANRKGSEQIAKLLPNAKLYVLEGGHELNVETADDFAEIIEL